jgi:hypothetical protein
VAEGDGGRGDATAAAVFRGEVFAVGVIGVLLGQGAGGVGQGDDVVVGVLVDEVGEAGGVVFGDGFIDVVQAVDVLDFEVRATRGVKSRMLFQSTIRTGSKRSPRM